MTTETKKRDIALVVDDSPETLRLLTDALDGAGMTVMVAMDGAAASGLTLALKEPARIRETMATCDHVPAVLK